MESSSPTFINDDFESETFPIIEEMEEFISYVGYFIFYASAISELKHLPGSAKQSVKRILLDAIKVQDMHQKSLDGEKAEELKERAEDIYHEIEVFKEMMKTNETILDKCLAYVDIHPKIRLQFGINAYFVSPCGDC